MLSLDNDWVEKDNIKIKIIEYRVRDFYGPFLDMCLETNKDETQKRVTTISSRMETPEVSESNFSLLSKAAKELYQKIGKFVIKTKLFEVEIDSDDTEAILIKKLKDLPLF